MTHCSSEIEASSSTEIWGIAVLTTVLSRNTISVPRLTTARISHFLDWVNRLPLGAGSVWVAIPSLPDLETRLLTRINFS